MTDLMTTRKLSINRSASALFVIVCNLLMLFVKCKNNGFHPHHICVPESYLFKIMIDIKNMLCYCFSFLYLCKCNSFI